MSISVWFSSGLFDIDVHQAITAVERQTESESIFCDKVKGLIDVVWIFLKMTSS